jgi:hypothetical protein
MKTANVLPEPLNFSQPRISFTQAMRARFLWRGQTHVVGSCDQSILTAFLLCHAGKAKLPAFQRRELLELLDYEDIGRWQCLDTALTFGVLLPLQRIV